jgi:hypothetical protein
MAMLLSTFLELISQLNVISWELHAYKESLGRNKIRKEV